MARRPHFQSGIEPPPHVARTDREVGALLDRGDQLGKHGGVVREVGVHLDHHVVATRQPDAEPGSIRGAEAGLRPPTQHLDAAEVDVELLGAVGGAVRAAVVDDEHVGVGERDACTLEHVVDVLDLVVRRYEHENAHRRASLPAR